MKPLVQRAVFSTDLGKKTPHYHDCHQIIFVTEGTVRFCVDAVEYTADGGHILVFNRYENHAVTVLSERYERYVLRLDPTVGGIESRVCSLLFNRPVGFCNAIDVSARLADFRHLFERIVAEYNAADKLSDDMQQLLINELLILLYRAIPDSLPFDGLVYDIQKQFERDCRGPYTLSTLARQYGISASALSHRFKQATGRSVMEYLLSCRMATAKRQLATTDLPISTIVETCGFSDNSNFARTFKKTHGITPTAFRETYTRQRLPQ